MEHLTRRLVAWKGSGKKFVRRCCKAVEAASARATARWALLATSEEGQRTPKTGLWTAMPAPCHSPAPFNQASTAAGVGKSQARLTLGLADRTPRQETEQDWFFDGCAPRARIVRQCRVPQCIVRHCQAALLVALGLGDQRRQSGHIGNAQIAPLAAQQTHAAKPTEFSRHGLAVRTDAPGDVGQGGRGR